MADIASRPAIAPRLPSRALGMALIILALLIALAVAFIGTRQTKLPAAVRRRRRTGRSPIGAPATSTSATP